jgi:hypothetical protein
MSPAVKGLDPLLTEFLVLAIEVVGSLVCGRVLA